MADRAETSAPREPMTVNSLVNEVHQAEDRYLLTHSDNSSPAGAARQALLEHAWQDVKTFTQQHPDETNALTRKLSAQGLLPQLTIAALQDGINAGGGHGAGELSQQQAMSMITRPDALGDAMRDHLHDAFNIKPGKGMGGGYADSTVPGDSRQPAITPRHVDELMHNFDHDLNYKPIGAPDQPREGFVDRLLDVADWVSHQF